ncbi:hypothetical protein VMUT_0156 [Vulcanisaeta moutnovskia 768-28]|uniref:Uncharacterized protein n=1 Tax=Vulcanisaeta moutnovskia (strain 768-28) TaxID=985053 RepID=F0QSV1_VULM7|nr:hypothetical protein VMUT_0156 [Vulcanisaeta moutnovskia 768-28]
MVMGLKVRWLILVVSVIAAVVVVSLFIIKFAFIKRGHEVVVGVGGNSSRHLPPLPVPQFIYYGSLACNGGVVIPGNSLIVLVYHVHGTTLINYVSISIDVPLTVINYSLPGPSQPGMVMGMGVYLNGTLIATSIASPTTAIATIVNTTYPLGNKTVSFWQYARAANWSVIHTGFVAEFPPINATPDDVIAVAIYSSIPYILPSCNVSSEAEEVQLMVSNDWIGFIPHYPNATPTTMQLYIEGTYITEEPIIYIATAQGLPRVIGMNNLTIFMKNTAPDYVIARYW